MNLTTHETQIVILALREYREQFSNVPESFDEVNDIMRRHQKSLQSKTIYKEHRAPAQEKKFAHERP